MEDGQPAHARVEHADRPPSIRRLYERGATLLAPCGARSPPRRRRSARLARRRRGVDEAGRDDSGERRAAAGGDALPAGRRRARRRLAGDHACSTGSAGPAGDERARRAVVPPRRPVRGADRRRAGPRRHRRARDARRAARDRGRREAFQWLAARPDIADDAHRRLGHLVRRRRRLERARGRRAVRGRRDVRDVDRSLLGPRPAEPLEVRRRHRLPLRDPTGSARTGARDLPGVGAYVVQPARASSAVRPSGRRSRTSRESRRRCS